MARDREEQIAYDAPGRMIVTGMADLGCRRAGRTFDRRLRCEPGTAPAVRSRRKSLAVDGVGVMKTRPDAANRFVQASEPPVADLEQLQETLQEGPCRDSVDTGEMITAANVSEMRWPAFAKAGAAIGVHAVLAAPMISRGRTFGTLDLYWRNEHRASGDDRAAAQLLANVAVSYLSMADDQARARAASEELAHRVMHDQLTGLPNRVLMEQLIGHALASSDRTGTLVAVLFVDLDHFKQINDAHGHQAGDDVLKTIAQRVHSAIRATDTVGRISGDEFIISCEGIDPADGSSQQAMLHSLTALVDRIRSHIAQPITLRHTPTPVTLTASIGIAVTTDHPSPAELIHTADQAMYQAKTAGRNRVAVLHHP